MTKPLSLNIRVRAMAWLAAGETVREAAAALSVAPSSVVKWSQRRRATRNATPGKIDGHVPRKSRGGLSPASRADCPSHAAAGSGRDPSARHPG